MEAIAKEAVTRAEDTPEAGMQKGGGELGLPAQAQASS